VIIILKKSEYMVYKVYGYVPSAIKYSKNILNFVVQLLNV